tara:strand:- start:276 stop:389 length:114 start_codon:yes stop_codon:yes gene_type:complete
VIKETRETKVTPELKVFRVRKETKVKPELKVFKGSKV